MKTNERRLLLLALAVVAIMGGIIMAKQFRSWQQSLTMREETLGHERDLSEAILQETAMWDARDAWITQHQPVAKDNLQADEESFKPLEQKARDLGLTIEHSQYLEHTVSPFWHQAGASMTVSGPLPTVFRWIYSVQSPTDFRVVPSLKITPVKDHPEQVTCIVQFWRWYQPMVTAADSSHQ